MDAGEFVTKLMFCRDELLGLDADEIGLAEIRSELIDCLTGVFGRTSWAGFGVISGALIG